NDEDNNPVLATRAWRPIQNDLSFDPQQIEPFIISGKIIGFNCMISTNVTDEGWEWESDWEDDSTNHIPHALELTIVMDPLEKGDKPFQIKRLVEIPASKISWQPASIRSRAAQNNQRNRQRRDQEAQQNIQQRRPQQTLGNTPLAPTHPTRPSTTEPNTPRVPRTR
ncbi:MAG: hypothetical protein GX811_05180, partial [Lentisphaerae bacterium]|nr:hypothetical protein [Lentisphaerota bacterium]